jgi:hypothetical protein
MVYKLICKITVYRRDYRISIILIWMMGVLNGYFGFCGNSISLHANWSAISGKLFDWLISFSICVISTISIGGGESQHRL